MAALRVCGGSCMLWGTRRLWRLASSPAMEPGVSRLSRKSLCLGVTTQPQRKPPMSSLIIVNLPWQYAAALAVVMLGALCAAAAAQEFAGREKLRAQSKEFRKEV